MKERHQGLWYNFEKKNRKGVAKELSDLKTFEINSERGVPRVGLGIKRF